MDKLRTVIVPNKYVKRSICRVHLELAHIIADASLATDKKQQALELIDEAFNMGKRMDEKLSLYKKGLISPKHKELNIKMHERPGGFGGSGYRWADLVVGFIERFLPSSVLDYGCGQETLWKAVKEILEHD